MSNINYPVTLIDTGVPIGDKLDRLVKMNNYIYNSGKNYRSLLTSNGGAAPTETNQQNDLSAAPVIARTSTGVYTITLAGAFTAAKTTAKITNLPIGVNAKIVRTSADVLTITATLETQDGATKAITNPVTDAAFSESVLEINVIP